jgi:hypothetical protein
LPHAAHSTTAANTWQLVEAATLVSLKYPRVRPRCSSCTRTSPRRYAWLRHCPRLAGFGDKSHDRQNKPMLTASGLVQSLLLFDCMREAGLAYWIVLIVARGRQAHGICCLSTSQHQPSGLICLCVRYVGSQKCHIITHPFTFPLAKGTLLQCIHHRDPAPYTC